MSHQHLDREYRQAVARDDERDDRLIAWAVEVLRGKARGAPPTHAWALRAGRYSKRVSRLAEHHEHLATLTPAELVECQSEYALLRAESMLLDALQVYQTHREPDETIKAWVERHSAQQALTFF